MKKITFICLLLFSVIASCSKSDEINSKIKLLPIDEAITPQSFTYGETDSISIKYSLPNGCHYYHSLYYQYQDTTRIVAVRAVELLNENCTQSVSQKERKFAVTPNQYKDYVFKFWKGVDANGEDLFEEKIVPVN